jgi:ribosome-associated protein
MVPLSSIVGDKELEFVHILSSGPGGQKVNKVSSAIQLRFDVLNSPSLDGRTKTALINLAGRKVNSDGVLVIEAKRHRSQEQNRLDAIDRLNTLLERALTSPKKRRATNPTLSSRRKRIQDKRKRSEIKRLRGSHPE